MSVKIFLFLVSLFLLSVNGFAKKYCEFNVIVSKVTATPFLEEGKVDVLKLIITSVAYAAEKDSIYCKKYLQRYRNKKKIIVTKRGEFSEEDNAIFSMMDRHNKRSWAERIPIEIVDADIKLVLPK